MVYFIAAHDPLRGEWLTIAVAVIGSASVVGRWTTK